MPVGQAVQALSPVLGLCQPDGHSLHTLLLVWASPASEYLPTSQAEQVVV